MAAEIARRLARAEGATCLLMPLQGIEGWDRPGEPLHDPEGLAAFTEALRGSVDPARLVELDAHINDSAFCDAALRVFDAWVADGTVPAGSRA
ncbi:hypothetical protein D3C72_1296030 [compost metagenome]